MSSILPGSKVTVRTTVIASERKPKRPRAIILSKGSRGVEMRLAPHG